MIFNNRHAETIAEILLNINAVKLQPYNFFTWSSGKKSPIYCDNRVILSHPNERMIIYNLLSQHIKSEFHSINYIAGVATGAIAHGMIIASKLNLPFIYVREKAKKHGRQNQIEGHLIENSNVLVIEDLISTGKSSINAIQAIEEQNSKVHGLISIFTYDFIDVKKMKTPCISLCDYPTLIKVAKKKKLITKEEAEILSNWKKQIII